MNKKINEIKEFFDDLSSEEFVELLVDAGFEVQKGTGKIIFKKEDSLSWNLKLKIPINTQPYKYNNDPNVGINMKFPKAC